MRHINNFSSYKKRKYKNDGYRSLFESIIPNEVYTTLKDWKDNNKSDCVLIGALALSYYIRPRYTEDMDLIFLSPNDIPTHVNKFRKNRPHSFEHIQTNVEIEVLYSEFLKIPQEQVEKIFETAIVSDGIKVASPVGIIALKLNRLSASDESDIINISKYCIENSIEINLKDFFVTDENIEKYNNLSTRINEYSKNMFVLENDMLLKNTEFIKIDNSTSKDIILFKDEFGEPRFRFGTNFGKDIFKYEIFQFSISLVNPIINGKINVLDSSTDYKSMNGFEKYESELISYLEKNIEYLRDEWFKVNKKYIKWN